MVVSGCAFLGAIGQMGFKKGMVGFKLMPIWTFPNRNSWLVLGLLCYLTSMVGYLAMIKLAGKEVPIIALYSIIALTYPLVALLSYLFLHESITYLKVLGSFVIVAGVLLILWG